MKFSKKEMNEVQINGEHPDIIIFEISKFKAMEHICVDVPSEKIGQTT